MTTTQASRITVEAWEDAEAGLESKVNRYVWEAERRTYRTAFAEASDHFRGEDARTRADDRRVHEGL